MSIVIKSNNVAVNNFGTSKMLGTSAEAEYVKYEARVLADGGVIKNESRTLAMFNLLFNSKMYGNMNSCVSGTFGVKTNEAGGITKLYAVDGADMNGVAYGTGTLPTLDVNGNITFAANNTKQSANGGMFTTTAKSVMSKVGNFGYSVSVKSIFQGDTDNYALAGLTKHNDVPNTATIAQLQTSRLNNGSVSLLLHPDPLNLTDAVAPISVNVAVALQGYPTFSAVHVTSESLTYGYRGGEFVTKPAGKIFSSITTDDFYLDFGGVYKSDGKKFNDNVVRDFMCFGQATKEQAMALSKFIP